LRFGEDELNKKVAEQVKYRRDVHEDPLTRALGIIEDEYYITKDKIKYFRQGTIRFLKGKDPVTGETVTEISKKLIESEEAYELDKSYKPLGRHEPPKLDTGNEEKFENSDSVSTEVKNVDSSLLTADELIKDIEKLRTNIEIPTEYKRNIDIGKANKGFLKWEDPTTLRGRFNRLANPPIKEELWPVEVDVLIVGGGAIGSSVAFHLKDAVRDGCTVLVIDKDMSYQKSSTVLSVGGIRQQFSIPENIMLSQYGMEFMRRMHHTLAIEGVPPPSVNFAPHGYLTLADEERLQQLKDNLYVQQNFNAKVKYLEKRELERAYPWMNCEGIAAGVVGVENEGWFDPWSLLTGLRQKAIHLGVRYIQGDLCGVEFDEGPFAAMMVGDHVTNVPKRIRYVKIRLPNGTVRRIQACRMVLATGTATGDIMYDLGAGRFQEGLMAFPMPIEPRKRYVYTFHAPHGPPLATPMVIDPSGTYFRREGLGNVYLAGRSPSESEEPPTTDLEVDHEWFQEKVWPVLAKRVPGFEELKVMGSWAGNYEYNVFDQNGIVGYHPLLTNVCVAAGFSGHGIQHSLGVGRAVSELITDGEFTSLDLSKFDPLRIMMNKPIYETCCV